MTGEEWYTRQVAGLTLKNNIRGHFNSIPIPVLDYVKACCCDAVTHPDLVPGVRTAVGSVITAIVTRGQPSNWPEVLELLVNAIDSANPLVVEVSKKKKPNYKYIPVKTISTSCSHISLSFE